MNPVLPTIEAELLDTVTGGRMSPGPVSVDPAIYQGMAQLAEALKSVGANLAQAKAAGAQQSTQMLSELMQRKMAGGQGR